MAKTLSQSADAKLYEEDFYLWVQRQADLLRAGQLRDLDLKNLIEEVEDLARSQQREVFSPAQQIIRHLVKLQYSAAVEPRRGWRRTVGEQRDELELVLTPSLRHELEAGLATRYQRARRAAARDLADHGEQVSDVPDACPYRVDQILDPEWLPESIHGLKDPG